jgi:hypothetical protein
MMAASEWLASVYAGFRRGIRRSRVTRDELAARAAPRGLQGTGPGRSTVAARPGLPGGRVQASKGSS